MNIQHHFVFMKLQFIMLVIWVLSSISLFGQNSWETIENSRLRLGVGAKGSLFNQNHPNIYLGLEAPKNSEITSIADGHIWVGALDDNDSFYVSAQTYPWGNFSGSFRDRTDFWHGPTANFNGGISDSIYDEQYNKVWKISRAEIDLHKISYSGSNYNIPWAIENWPANGDTQRGEAAQLAPFTDINGNSIYEPQLGDYPKIIGDQALYFILNDTRYSIRNSKGKPLNIEVHGMMYLFEGVDEDLQNTVFLNYKIINRNQNINYHDVMIGSWTNFYLGCWDYLKFGSDTSLNAYFSYKPFSNDSTCGNITRGYKEYPAAQGVKFLNHKMKSFVRYAGISGASTYPSQNFHYWNLLNGKWRNGEDIVENCIGILQNNEPATKFLFYGDPSDSLSFSDANCPFYAGSFRGSVGAIGPFSLPAGNSICVDLAFSFMQDSSIQNNIQQVILLKERMNNIQLHFDNSFLGCEALLLNNSRDISGSETIKIFPNPVTETMHIQYAEKIDEANISVCDLNGKIVFSKNIYEGKIQINASSWSKGFYMVKVKNKEKVYSSKFIKL